MTLTIIYLFLISTSAVSALLESISYTGFIEKHLPFSSSNIYIVTFVVAIIVINYGRKFPSLIFRSALAVKYIAISSAITTTILLMVEGLTYDNFVYSTIHLRPENLPTLALILAFHYSLIYTKKPKLPFVNKKGVKILLNYPKVLILLVLGYYFILNSVITLKNMTKVFVEIIQNPRASYGEKMSKRYSGSFEYFQLVKQHTEDDASIIIPPQLYPWGTVGNGGMAKYFLYPRRVYNGAYDDLLRDNFEEEFNYVMIARGTWLYSEYTDDGWPRVDVEAESVTYFDLETGTSTTVDGDFTTTDKEQYGYWGIIKVK